MRRDLSFLILRCIIRIRSRLLTRASDAAVNRLRRVCTLRLNRRRAPPSFSLCFLLLTTLVGLGLGTHPPVILFWLFANASFLATDCIAALGELSGPLDVVSNGATLNVGG
jgi:hypothetical protein